MRVKWGYVQDSWRDCWKILARAATAIVSRGKAGMRIEQEIKWTEIGGKINAWWVVYVLVSRLKVHSSIHTSHLTVPIKALFAWKTDSFAVSNQNNTNSLNAKVILKGWGSCQRSLWLLTDEWIHEHGSPDPQFSVDCTIFHATYLLVSIKVPSSLSNRRDLNTFWPGITYTVDQTLTHCVLICSGQESHET